MPTDIRGPLAALPGRRLHHQEFRVHGGARYCPHCACITARWLCRGVTPRA